MAVHLVHLNVRDGRTFDLFTFTAQCVPPLCLCQAVRPGSLSFIYEFDCNAGTRRRTDLALQPQQRKLSLKLSPPLRHPLNTPPHIAA